MVGNPMGQVLTFPAMLSSSSISRSKRYYNVLPYPPFKLGRGLTRVKAMSDDTGQNRPPSKNPMTNVTDIPKNICKQTLRPLSDYGFGRRSMWEGAVGLFLVSGTIVLALSLVWLRQFQLHSKFRKYMVVFEFAQACGISTGTPVRIRGVTVGNIIRVNPSLKSIKAVVEVDDDKTIIPLNSRIEVNQSGLLMETIIDITPCDPVPEPSAGPRDPECIEEGLIVCDKQKIKGSQGVSLDAMVGIFTRLGREMEEIGIASTYALAERVALVIQEAKPLLSKIEAMTDDVQPLLSEVRNSGLLKEVENLTKSLTVASEDLSFSLPFRRVHSSIMIPENAELIQRSVYSLILTLKNVESISSDVLGFTGDESTRRNLKLLIRSLRRLV